MRYFLCLFIFFDTICAYAQIEDVVSLRDSLHNDSLIFVMPTGQPTTLRDTTVWRPNRINIKKENALFESTIQGYSNLELPYQSVTPGYADVFRWRNGGISASGFSATYPGLMKIDSGTVGLYQRFGNLSLYVGGIANKYGYFRGIHTQYGINGSLSYQFTPNLSFTAFGTYYFSKPPVMSNGLPMPPSMIGFYSTSRFGGYFDYRVSDSFGVKVGAQTIQQVGTNLYEFEPIATPYINVGNEKRKFKIELPVGQILYNALKK